MAWKSRGLTRFSLEPYVPFVVDQGDTRSCVGWAVGYEAFSIAQAIQNRWQYRRDIITRHAFSGYFIYNKIRVGDCDDGAFISDALWFLYRHGDIPYVDFEMQGANCKTMPNEAQLQSAQANRIKGFQRVFHRENHPEQRIYRTKQVLAQQKPVIIALELLPSFKNLKASTWIPKPGESSNKEYHAMVVIGFDDEKGAFRVMNSWGTDWGEDGFAWIRYRDFGKLCDYAFQFADSPKPETEPFTNSSFQVRRLNPNIDGHFMEVSAFYAGSQYRLNKPLAPNDRIQVEMHTSEPGQHLYIFGLDQDGKTFVSWQGFTSGKVDTAGMLQMMIPGKNLVIRCPGETGALQLFIIYGKYPIPDVESRLAMVQPGAGNFSEQLRSIFRPYLLTQDQVWPLHDKMTLERPTGRQGNVMAVVEMEVR